MPPKKGDSSEKWAAYYGWAMALLKSDSSLWEFFEKAKKQGWEKPKFIAELRKTKWYQAHGATARETLALKYTDPETWRQRVRTIYQNIMTLAGSMGIHADWKTYWDMAEDALMMGWDQAKLRSALSTYLKGGKGGYEGEAGDAEDQLRQYAYQMGVKLDDGALGGWLKGILNGSKTVNDYKGYLQQMALGAFPGLSEQIKGGMMVRDIASPYMDAMQRILEVNGGALDLFDPTIRKAMSMTDTTSGKQIMKPLWQFEEELRKDPRWLKTNNARQSLNSSGRDILKQFGMVF